MVADDDDMQDWVVDYNREGWERAARDGRDSKVAIMAVAAEDRGSGQWRQWRTRTLADNDGMQDWVADYDGEGWERVAIDGGDSGVAMMAAAAEDGGGKQQRQRWSTTAADDNGTQDRVADYNGEGQERVANNNIRCPAE